MGKMAIIVIVGLTTIVGIIASSMIGRSTDSAKSSEKEFARSYARNISSSAADYFILQLKTTPTLRGTFAVSNILNGTASVTVADWVLGSSDSVMVLSVGRYSGVAETTLALLTSSSALPRINAAISFRSVAPTFSASGTLDIDGRNHSITGALLPPSADDRPGVAVINPPDTSIFVPARGSQINGTVDAAVDPAIPDPTTFVPALIAKADYVLTGSYSSPQTWGSAGSPAIVYCTGSVKFSQICDGWGILIADKLESTNKFTWRGLVIVMSSADWKTSNTMLIYGGLLFHSTGSSKYNSSGVARLYYSTAGLTLAEQAAGGGGGSIQVAGWMK